MNNCILCNKERMLIPFIYEDDKIMVFMDMEPANEGHVLLSPKEHYLDICEVPDELLSHMMIMSKKIISVLKEIYPLDGYSIMQNVGDSNDIRHYHLHIFSRYTGEGPIWKSANKRKIINQQAIDRIIEKLQG